MDPYKLRTLPEMKTISLLVLIIKLSHGADQDCAKMAFGCNAGNCRDCIRTHHCCVWNYDEKFKGSRCGIKGIGIDSKFLAENLETNANVVENAEFADVEDDPLKAVQFRPQEYDVRLRVGEPVNISIQYQPARNFPLDLYYLMDLTISMKPDLSTVRSLGMNLTDQLSVLTKNHKIAFGSYIDKPLMPFYMTDEPNYKNPCNYVNDTCEGGYLFKHRLNFTDNISNFIQEVGNSHVSANLDDPEGGMEALMQIVLCGAKLAWSSQSRKLVLVATDGTMHLAGDGLLSGSVRRNRERCLIDDFGNYVNPTLYDYPSLEEIHRELRDKKISVIVAARDNRLKYYQQMNEVIPEATFVGELKEDSTNVLHLVRDGYYAFIREVGLSINTKGVKGLKLDFFVDCEGNGMWVRGETCSNAQEGKPIDFVVQFLLQEHQDPDKSSETLYVEESKIDDRVKLNVEFVGSYCNCPRISSTPNCINGIVDCGNCTCNDGWTGSNCNEICANDIDKCRIEEDGILSLTCSGNGQCICSKCRCEEPFGGNFCQHQCPVDPSTRLICGGHGSCDSGACICNPRYSGEHCTCFESEENCKLPWSNSTCNDNGNCKCNRCACREGYSGYFCEVCDKCEGLCSDFEDLVVENVVKKNKTDTDAVTVRVVEDLGTREECNYRYYLEDGATCHIIYGYTINSGQSFTVQSKEPACSKPLGAMSTAFIIVAAVLALGILAVLIVKARNMYKDKAEYEEFLRQQAESGSSREQNPIYKSPVTFYRNPVEQSTSRV